MILFDKDFSYSPFHHHSPFSSFSIITNKQHELCKHPLIFFYWRNPLIAHKATRLALHSLCHITITYLYTYPYDDMHEYVFSYVFVYMIDCIFINLHSPCPVKVLLSLWVHIPWIERALNNCSCKGKSLSCQVQEHNFKSISTYS